jgi:hypothetical protein
VVAPPLVPVFAPVVVPCEAPPLAPLAGLAAGLAGAAGLGAGFLSSAARARLAAPSNPARIKAAELYATALRRNWMVIVSSVSFPAPRAILDARSIYSTLLTFPFVNVTFMSL